MVRALIKVYLSLHASSDDVGRGLEAAFREVPLERIVDGIVEHASEDQTPENLLAVVELLPTPLRDITIASSLTTSQREGLSELLRRVGQIAFARRDTERSILPKLALLLAAVGNEDDVALIAQWFATEQSRLDTYLEDRRKEQREGRSVGVLQWINNHPNWYCPALAMFRGPAAEQVLIGLLRSPRLIAHAAAGLEDLCVFDGLLPPAPSGLDASAKRWRKPSSQFVPNDRVHARANAIAAALDELEMGASAEPNLAEYAHGAAGILARLRDERGIDRLLQQHTRRLAHLSLFALRVAVLRGAILPGRTLIAAFESLIKDGEVQNQNGGYDQSWQNSLEAFALILASDTPTIAIERMRRLPPHRLQSYPRRDLVDILAASEQPVAAAYLIELSEGEGQEHTPQYEDVIYALGRSRDARCHLRIVTMIATNVPERAEPIWDALKWAAGHIAKHNEALARNLVSALRASQVAIDRRLAWVLAQVRSPSMLALLLERDNLLALEAPIGELLDDLSEDHIPVDYANAYEVVPRDASEPRRLGICQRV